MSVVHIYVIFLSLYIFEENGCLFIEVVGEVKCSNEIAKSCVCKSKIRRLL